MKAMLKRTLAVVLSCAMLTSSASALTAQETLDLLDLYYLDEVPAASRELETAEGILASLGDPYTVYMPATDYELFLSGVDGSTVTGIGAMIHQVQNKGVEIITVLPDSPAIEAGLVAGDIIVAVNGIETISSSIAQELLSGAEGTELSVTILHEDGSQKTYEMVRSVVNIPVVNYYLMDGVPYINCSSFSDDTSNAIREALETYINSEVPYILDLRQNPGGLDTAVAGSAGWFLGGITACYYLNSQGNVSRLYTYVNTPDFTDQPVIVLTSTFSASGSEMFAGAVRAYEGGIAIGARTYGKGVAQVVLDETSHPELFDGDSVKITKARFYAADGATNDVVGVIPTLTIDTAYVTDVAVLLSAALPQDTEGFLKLELAGSTFYVDLEQAMSEEYIAAFQNLLESLAVTQYIYLSLDGEWLLSGGEGVASYLGIPYESRGYTDAISSPYYNQLSALAASRILPVQEDGSLGVGETLTRGDFAYLLAYALQLRVVEGNPFADVSNDDQNMQAIAALYAKGIVQGDEEGNFNPDDLITHQEAVVMLANAATWLSLDALTAQYEGFTDEEMTQFASYEDWAQESAAVLKAVDGLLKDSTPATVQMDEGAAMIYELLDGCNLIWN